MAHGFEILYEDGPCLAVCKPPGVLTQAPPGIDSLELRIKDFLQGRSGEPGDVYLGIPHRLDRPASGVMLFATQPRAAPPGRAVRAPPRAQGLLGVRGGDRGPAGRHLDRFCPQDPGATPGRGGAARSSRRPPGRAPLSHSGLGPVGLLAGDRAGDRAHAPGPRPGRRAGMRSWAIGCTARSPFGAQYEDERLRAVALHARSLTFEHPLTRESISVTAPVPDAWRTLGLVID